MISRTPSRTQRTAAARISGALGYSVLHGSPRLGLWLLVGILLLTSADVNVVSQTPDPKDNVANKKANVRRLDPGTIPSKVRPVLKLSVDKTNSYVGETRTFSLSIDGPVINSSFVFTIDFGDGTRTEKPEGSSEVAHVYRTADKFTVTVTPSRPPGSEIFAELPEAGNSVTVLVNQFSLDVKPTNANAGDLVSFQTQPVSTDSSIRYRFHFGDGSKDSDWTNKAATTHKYLSKGTFKTWVEIGREAGKKGPEPIAKSKEIPITVTLAVVPGPTVVQSPTPPSPISISIPWREILIGIALFVGGVLLLATSIFTVKRISKWLWPPRPVFRARPDRGNPTLNGARDVAVNFRLRLNANTSAGRYQLSDAGTNLVKSIRRGNG